MIKMIKLRYYLLALAFALFARSARGADINLSTEIKNGFYALEGPTKIESPVDQHTLSYSDRSLDAFLWLNHDLERDRITEVDLGFKVQAFEAEIADGTLTAKFGYEVWTYPEVNAADHAAVVGLSYYRYLQLKTTIKKVLNDSQGYVIIGSVSKRIALDENISLKPEVSTVFTDDYFGLDGLTYIRGGVTLSRKVTKNVDFNVSAIYQKSLDEKVDDALMILAGFNINL